ncbi:MULTISPECIES: NAD-dependent epimerase/dehydratase family protein [unclassified Streptomyces]|uniref:NAD-dependent epimerase/dehydratase family protein n=1 Tax=unclassified Streptomyces TaxID=2593676 RepID=UPI0036B02018
MTADRWAGRTVLVTGALGFIGSHFVRQLEARGAEVLALYRTERPQLHAELAALDRVRLIRTELRDESDVRGAFKYLAPSIDTVVHCAAMDGNAQFKLERSAEILDSNQRTISHLLNCVRDFGVGEAVVMSSSELYCAPPTAAAHEDDDFRRSMRYTDNGYVLSKTYGEILARLHREQFGTNVFLVRPGNVYGPGDGYDPSRGRVIPSMLAKADAGEEIEIWGDGSQTRSFVHVTDLVRASLRLLETGKYPEMNVAGAEQVSILELARMVMAVLGRPERIRLDPGRPVGAPSRLLDLTRMSEVIDFEPQPLRTGLEETARWFRHHTR